MTKFLRLVCLICMVASQTHAADRPVDASYIDKTPVSLTEYLAVLEDPEKTLTLADLQKPEVASRFKSEQSPAAALSLGYSRSAFWLRLTVRNDSDHALDQMLELSHPRLSSVEFFNPGLDGAYQTTATGNALEFASRPHPSRFFVFPVHLSAHSDQVFYLRIHSTNSILIPAKLWSTTAFHTYERNDYLAQAWYFGMASAMMLFNLLLFFALRDPIYLLYVGFVACSAWMISTINGLASEFFWPMATLWSDVSYYVVASITITVLISFMRRMLNTARVIPKFDHVLKLLIGVLLAAPIFYIIDLQTYSKAAAQLNLASIVLILASTLLCVFKRERSAYFFLAAFSMLVIGGVMTALRSLGMLPTSTLSTYGLQVGSAFEMILLALALADRFNVIRQEKVQAQHEALEAEYRVVETLRNSERKLESKVSERTAELTSTINDLKQTQAVLVQADKLASLGALVAGVAHELNTPIGNALITASALEEAASKLNTAMSAGEMRKSSLVHFVDNAVPMAELIVRSCQRAASLINSFKQVAVDQTSELRRAFDLHVLLVDNIAALRPSFKRDPWTIDIQVPTPITCDSYPGPLGQIITNLVNNAITHAFADREKGTLIISATLKGDTVHMRFMDDGKGMNSSVAARIFEPFFTTRLGQGGSGLGLSISHNIATGVLGGTLVVTAEPDEGSTFHLSFPLIAPK